MGVDVSAKLVFGWEVDYEKLNKFLVDSKVGSCGGDYKTADDGTVSIKHQCYCIEDCWENTDNIPKDITIVKASPYYDADTRACYFFVSLINDNMSCGIDEVTKIINNKELIVKAKEFVEKLGGSTLSGPKLSAEAHVW